MQPTENNRHLSKQIFATLFTLFVAIGFHSANAAELCTPDQLTGDISNHLDCENPSDILELGPANLSNRITVRLSAPAVRLIPVVSVELGTILSINTFRPSRSLNDTGIVACGNDSSNNVSCPVSTHPGQDADHGRDAVVPRDDSDGHAGFSFTRMGSECVKDNVTGLIWEVKTNDGGLHDRDDRYSWYNADSTTNGGFPGIAQSVDNCYGYGSDAATWCNTEAYVARVNQAGWCGFKDWRMPTIEELVSLVDYSIPFDGPTIDPVFFPIALGWEVWSMSPSVSENSSAWFLNFSDGHDDKDHKRGGRYIRLVRNGQ